MDVWFDSGSSWNGVLNERGLSYPSDLYLEGNDQYRGWFNASLILSVAYSGKAPFKTCLTHGWVMDENWQKMSKSAGNGIDPSKVANTSGADLLRLWASSVNFEADVAISESIIKTIADQYRKIRNTFKFMLGNLQDGADKPYIPGEKPALWPVDNWVLAQFEEVKNGVLAAYESFSFSKVQMLLTNFMVELSSFYLDMTKDIMYCEKASSPRRKAVQYVLYKLTKELCLLFNPILSFTMDEVYSYLPGEKKASPQLEDMPSETHEYGEEDKAMYAKFKDYRALVLKALENKRNEGLIGSSLEAELSLKVADAGLYEVLSKLEKDELARYFGASETEIEKAEENSVIVSKDEHEVCERCRTAKIDVKERGDGHHLCDRCAKAIE
jgi:isoleucyl-tRNA synthetase